MLVLTRKQGESILISDDVKVIVLDTPDNQQRIGIIAPREVAVHRSEVYERIQATEVNGNRKACW